VPSTSGPFLSPLDRRILFVMPSGPAALSDGRRFIISLTSSRVGVLLSLGSGMCESEGCGLLSVCVTRSASDSSQGERGRFRRFVLGGIYIDASFV